MKNATEQEADTRQVGLLKLVSMIVAGFGAAFGMLATTFSFLRSSETPWVTLIASIVCLVVAGSVFLVERSQS